MNERKGPKQNFPAVSGATLGRRGSGAKMYNGGLHEDPRGYLMHLILPILAGHDSGQQNHLNPASL